MLLLSGPGEEAWRPAELQVKGPPPVTDFAAVQNLALQYLGRPYITGGVGSPGFDCSGFVCRVYAEAGYGLPRVSRDQAEAGLEVPLDAVMPGDLLFFAEPGAPVSHVGLFLGDGQMIHASSGRGEVVVAPLDQTWFTERLVGARRVLSSTVSGGASPFLGGPVRELVEHQGRFSLAPMVRRPSRRPPPSYGPQLTGAGITSVGFRSGFLTEAGVLGAVLAPEATLHIERWAFELAVAVPVRLEVDEDITLGTFDKWQDYLRFLRTVRLGLPGADLELRLSRLGDATLGSGFMLDRVAPGTAVRGVPGLTVTRSPLMFFGGLRTDVLELEAFMDDALDPALLGAGVTVPLGPFKLGAAVASDQQARFQSARRAFTSAELSTTYAFMSDRTKSLDVRLSAAMISALGDAGAGGRLSVLGQWRPKGSVTVSAALEAGVLGQRFLAGLFGPTYLANRDAHGAALPGLLARGDLGARVEVSLGRLSFGGTYAQGVGANQHPLDRRLEGFVAVQALALSRARRLDIRLAFLSRAPFNDTHRAYTAHGGARVTLMRWLFAELYVQKSETWEGGGGLTVTWAP